MILTTIGFIIAGAVLAGALLCFWDDIKEWLNTVAANAVERAFGYAARDKMHKAVACIDKVADKIKNTSVVYSKRDVTELYFDKTTITAEADASSLHEDILAEFNKHNNRLVQEFNYKC